VFYHVYAPDGVFVTGYATPPVPREQVAPEATQTYYDAIYQNAPVRALRFSQSTSIDGLSGPFTFTVWQATSVRDGFVASRTWPVFLVIAAMISALFVIVWFGVARGLAPLIDLEDAIASRSAEDLSPIKRKIPQETSRSGDLLIAARDTAHLANNLLTLERAQTAQTHMNVSEFDPNSVLETIAAKVTTTQADAPFTFTSHLTSAHAQALGRFRQIGSGPGTGLGLPITAAVTSSFGGTLKPITQDGSFALTLTFPLAAAQQNVVQ